MNKTKLITFMTLEILSSVFSTIFILLGIYFLTSKVFNMNLLYFLLITLLINVILKIITNASYIKYKVDLDMYMVNKTLTYLNRINKQEYSNNYDFISNIMVTRLEFNNRYLSYFKSISSIILIICFLLYLLYSNIVVFILTTILIYILSKMFFANYEKNKFYWEDYRKNIYNYLSISRSMMDNEHFEDRFLFDANSFLQRLFTKEFDKGYKKNRTLTLNRSLNNFKMWLVSILFVLIILMYLNFFMNDIYLIYTVLVSIMIIINRYISINSDLFSVINLLNIIRNLSKNRAVKDENISEKVNELQVNDISFAYSKQKKLVIEHLNYKFIKGKNYLIVGLNGAGKTTLSRLLLRQYDLNSGEILINKKNIAKYNINEIKQLFSYQSANPIYYNDDFYHNVAIGKAIDKEKIKQMLLKVNKSFYKKYYNSLSNNKNYSVGEKHNAFILRNLYQNKQINIYDEPTSNLDIMAEDKYYKRIIDSDNRDSINIFISHRLGISKVVDEILVLHEGKIIESGSYQDLIKKRGLFYEMYEKQKWE